jgi:hypothetical protein
MLAGASLLQASAHVAAYPADWVQLGVGVVGFVGGLRLRNALPARLGGFAWLPTLWMMASALVAVVGGYANALHERAPVVAGLVGLVF